MNELISVIINVYNGQNYIKKCLDSIINQTYKNIEIIIVNDGSTDKTLDILKEYKDKRIKIITTKNQGLSLSRNTGIDNSKGNFLYFVDVDDFIENDTIEYLYKLQKKYNSKITLCDSLNIYDYNFKNKKLEEKITIQTPKEMIKKILLNIGYVGTIWNKLIDKKLFEKIKFENRIVNDVVVMYKLYIESEKIIYSNQKKYYYLKHNDSIVAKREKERQIDMYKASLERYNYIKKMYPEFIENEAGMLLMIFNLYLKDYEKIKEFYKKEKIKKTYNKIFTFKILKCDMRLNDKIKLIIFRFSPKLSKKITQLYIFFHKKRIEV